MGVHTRVASQVPGELFVRDALPFPEPDLLEKAALQGLGFRVWGSGFGVQGLGFRV